jgi:uncharacterized protein YndB with AHSA1/START domain
MPTTPLPLPSLVEFNTVPLARAARLYAERGIPVFPLVPREKVPRVAHGFYRATTDLSQIERWWSDWPNAIIGIATGSPSRLWVLDIDPRHGGLRSLDMLERHAKDWGATMPLSATLRQLTGGGGIHLFYQMPSSPGVDPPNGTFAGYQGIELKKTGGYIVAPPSQHPSGLVYQWQQDDEPAPFPPALIEIFVEARQRAFSRASAPAEAQTRWREARASPTDRELDPEYWLHVSLRKAAPGSRHNYACFLAIQLISIVGCSFEEAESWMREYVAQVTQLPSDPYELDDALACLRYAWWKYAS